MSHAHEKRSEARRLRREYGLTIDRLAAQLSLPRSTVYSWVGDIPIPGSGPGGGFTAEARSRGTEASRRGSQARREWAYLEGCETFAIFARSARFREFVAIYIASGYKGDSAIVSLGSADPQVLRLALYWLGLVARNPIRAQLLPLSGSDPRPAVAGWADRLKLDPALIRIEAREGVADPAGAGRTASVTGDLSAAGGAESDGPQEPTGILRLTVSDTLLRCELQAWMDCARAEWRLPLPAA